MRPAHDAPSVLQVNTEQMCRKCGGSAACWRRGACTLAIHTKEGRVANDLRNKRVAALVENAFGQSELLEPKKALENAGARVDVVSPQNGKVKGWKHTDWGEQVNVDRELDAANASDYDALLLPGGVMNPDKLRVNRKAVQFVKHF